MLLSLLLFFKLYGSSFVNIILFMHRYQEVVEQIAEVEACIARAQSVRHKVLGDSHTPNSSFSSPLEALVLRLLDSPEVTLDGGPRGPAAAVIRKLFQQAQRVGSFINL